MDNKWQELYDAAKHVLKPDSVNYFCNNYREDLMEFYTQVIKEQIPLDFIFIVVHGFDSFTLRKLQTMLEHPRNKEIDKEILDYFLDDNGTKWYYYNVFSVFNWLVNKISDKEASIHVTAEIDGEVYSEIEMVKGIVKKHVVTQIINEGEMRIIKRIFAKRLNEFLLEEKNRISK